MHQTRRNNPSTRRNSSRMKHHLGCSLVVTTPPSLASSMTTRRSICASSGRSRSRRTGDPSWTQYWSMTNLNDEHGDDFYILDWWQWCMRCYCMELPRSLPRQWHVLTTSKTTHHKKPRHVVLKQEIDHILYTRSAESGIGGVLKQWCLLTFRPLHAFLPLYLQEIIWRAWSDCRALLEVLLLLSRIFVIGCLSEHIEKPFSHIVDLEYTR